MRFASLSTEAQKSAMAGQREGWGAGLRTPTRPAISLGLSGFSLFHSSILPQLKDDILIEKKARAGRD
jgi:hypothetical protein